MKKVELSNVLLNHTLELSKSYCYKHGFFEGCDSRCNCLEVIFDKEETEEQSVSKITRSRRNTLMQLRESFEGDTYDFMRVMDQTK